MGAPFNSKAVANHFLELAKRDGQTIDPMKIQKLAYYAHGFFLALYDKPLLDDRVEAWKWGPVIPSLYHEFKQYGGGPIVGLATDVEFVGDGKFRIFTPQLDDSPGVGGGRGTRRN